MSNIHKNFNSRTREGATKKQLGGRIGLLVSIHAPVWVRLIWDWVRPSLVLFQFTHPCGCDFPPCGIIRSSSCFNSRTRVGATIKNGKGKFNKFVSIHAPVWVRRPDEYGLSIKHATKVLRQPDARTRCGQA